jgi:type IV pilus assembly protein PilY1
MAGALMGVLMLLSLQAPAAPLQFSTAPPGSNYRKPAPNVIVSMDDSGSMATKDSAGVSGIETLRNALIDTFSEANVPDGSIRLAWQSMARCYTIPAGACGNLNQMRVLDSTHRSNFMTWVGTLAASGYTPSHRMLLNAGEYLRTDRKSVV